MKIIWWLQWGSVGEGGKIKEIGSDLASGHLYFRLHKKTEKSYANRSDAKTGAYSVEEGGRETHEWAPDLETVKTRAESPIEFLQRVLSDQSALGFFESVYRDIDEVLTLRVWQ